jgi:uncharacterized membrane protein YcaP (DUF421 family)
LEVSGQLGYMLKKEKQPATKEDIQTLIQLIQNGQLAPKSNQSANPTDIFTVVANPGASPSIPRYLQ